MTDVDQILRDHATAADRTEPASDGWDRLVARLEDEPPIIVPIDGRGAPTPARRPGRWAMTAAAAVIVAVLVAGAVALTRTAGEDDDLIRPADTTAATTAPTTAPTTEVELDPETGRPVFDGPPMPERIVAIVDHDDDGLADLVRLEGIGVYEDVEGPDGTTATGLREPEVTVLVSGASVAPDRITSVDVGPDDLALYGVCCGTTEGEVRGVRVSDGVDRGTFAAGAAPALSGDGRRLATIIGDRIQVLVVGTLQVQGWLDLPDGGDEVTHLSLSPDGSRLARQRVRYLADGKVATTFVDVVDVDDPQGWTTVDPDGGIGLPVFIGDGDVLGIGLETDAKSEGTDEVEALQVGMADLATGEVQWSVGIPAVDIDATPDGGWVIADFDGGLRAYYEQDGWLWDSGTILQLDGMVDAAW